MNCTFRVLIATAAVLAAATHPAGAQQPQQQQAPNAPQPNAAPPAPGIAMPDVYRLNTLIRSSIIALNQANKTGNYTVLQDLGAPAFRASNDSARLAQVFGQLRQRNLDLSPILFFTPKLVRPPQIAPNGILRLVGYFPTSPERVLFDLYFQQVAGDWRIFGIGVSMSPAEVTSAIPPTPQPGEPGSQHAEAEEPKPSSPAKRHAEPAKAAANEKKPAAPSHKPAAAHKAPAPAEKAETGATSSKVQNSTSTNATRIDLSDPKLQSGWKGEEASGTAKAEDNAPPAEKGFWDGLNPFGD